MAPHSQFIEEITYCISSLSDALPVLLETAMSKTEKDVSVTSVVQSTLSDARATRTCFRITIQLLLLWCDVARDCWSAVIGSSNKRPFTAGGVCMICLRHRDCRLRLLSAARQGYCSQRRETTRGDGGTAP